MEDVYYHGHKILVNSKVPNIKEEILTDIKKIRRRADYDKVHNLSEEALHKYNIGFTDVNRVSAHDYYAKSVKARKN